MQKTTAPTTFLTRGWLTCEEVAGDDDIGKVHTVADQEGLVEEVVVQDLDSHLDDLINPLEDLLNCIMPRQGKTLRCKKPEECKNRQSSTTSEQGPG